MPVLSRLFTGHKKTYNKLVFNLSWISKWDEYELSVCFRNTTVNMSCCTVCLFDNSTYLIDEFLRVDQHHVNRSGKDSSRGKGRLLLAP